MSRKQMVPGKLGLALSMLVALSLAACATPDAPDPRGKWRPVNRFADAPQAIPLHEVYVFQASPVDGTLKSMLSRWAKDSHMTLSYLHPSDFTLYGPVADIRTPSLVQAAAALNAAYQEQGVTISVSGAQIVVSVAAQPAAAGQAD